MGAMRSLLRKQPPSKGLMPPSPKPAEPNKIPVMIAPKQDNWSLFHEIKAPGWELVERRIERENIANWTSEFWTVIRARHSQLGLDIQAEYRFDADPNITYERRKDCVRKLWRQMILEEAVEAGLV